jgi:hypothetical protein
MLNDVMMSVVTVNVIMLWVCYIFIMLSVIKLNDTIMSVVMLCIKLLLLS